MLIKILIKGFSYKQVGHIDWACRFYSNHLLYPEGVSNATSERKRSQVLVKCRVKYYLP